MSFLTLWQNDDTDISDAAQRALVKVFLRFLQTKEMVDVKDDTSSTIEFKAWLRKCYEEFKEGLLTIVEDSPSASSQHLALSHSFKLLQCEGKYPLETAANPSANAYFPNAFLKAICSAMLSSTRDMTSVIDRYREFTVFDDVKFYTLKALHGLLKDAKEVSRESGNLSSTAFVVNAHSLLALIQFPVTGKKTKKRKSEKKPKKSDDVADDEPLPIAQVFVEPINVEWQTFVLDYDRASGIFSSVWLLFLSFEVSLYCQKIAY